MSVLLTGIADCELLDWDTDFWRFRVARMSSNSLSKEQLDEVDRWCRQQNVQCVYFLAPSDDPDAVAAAEAACFKLVDIRLTLVYSGSPSTSPNGWHGTVGVGARHSQKDDVPALEQIARFSHRDTRFYFDRNFPRQRCDDLYATWIRRSCDGFADTVLVAEAGGEPVGYVSCHLDRVGRIGLLGTSPQARGNGVGTALVRAALAWFLEHDAREVEVVTHGRNCVAQRLYQRCGFVTKEVQLWYHKWYPSDGQ